MISGDAGADDGESRRVDPDPVVLAERGDEEDHRQGVHRNALVPAQLARDQTHGLTQVEAADRCGQCDAPCEPQGRAAEELVRAGLTVATRDPDRHEADRRDVGGDGRQREERPHGLESHEASVPCPREATTAAVFPTRGPDPSSLVGGSLPFGS